MVQDPENPKQLSFTFSVVSDDGNLPSALVAGSSDLLSQLMNGNCATIWSCLIVFHQGPASDENMNGTNSYVVDPTMEETQNLSNNLMMVTLLKRPGSSVGVEDSEMNDEDQEANSDPLIIEKVSEALRTCYSVQMSTSLTFKPNSMSMAQLREAVVIGKKFAKKAATEYQQSQSSVQDGQTINLTFAN